MSLMRRSSDRQHGFTLMEVALAIVIVGVAMVALMEVLAAGSRSNADSQQVINGGNLVSSIREMTVRLDSAQIRALNGTLYAPAVDATGAPLGGIGDWSQRIDVAPINIDQLTQVVAAAPIIRSWRVTATAL